MSLDGLWRVFLAGLSNIACIRRTGLALPSAADLLSDTGGSAGMQPRSLSLPLQPVCQVLRPALQISLHNML